MWHYFKQELLCKRQYSYKQLSTKNSSNLNKFLHSEVNQLIQHIIVQDLDGQNNVVRMSIDGPANSFRGLNRSKWPLTPGDE